MSTAGSIFCFWPLPRMVLIVGLLCGQDGPTGLPWRRARAELPAEWGTRQSSYVPVNPVEASRGPSGMRWAGSTNMETQEGNAEDDC